MVKAALISRGSQLGTAAKQRLRPFFGVVLVDAAVPSQQALKESCFDFDFAAFPAVAAVRWSRSA